MEQKVYYKRKIEEALQEARAHFPVVLITGARQAGKSTLLQHSLKDYSYVNLDDPQKQELAKNDPELFLSHYQTPIIIDEIQYAPQLLPYIKIRVDQNRRKYGQYILTGSQTFQVMEGVSESLAGRIAIFHLFPMSWEEAREIPSWENAEVEENAMMHQLIKGFYPEFFVNPTLNPNTWHASYLATYIQRDVRNIKAITDLGRFQTFLALLAARTGQLLNLSEVAKECGISHPTAKDWLSILESTYIIYLLRPFHNNRSKRLVKTPKIYFTDTGLLCYLLGIETPEQLLKIFDRGHVFENMVIMECVKKLSYRKEHAECFFYRTANQVEVDLVVQRKGHLEAYEIKFAKTLSKEMTSGLETFMKDHASVHASILSLKQETVPLKAHISAMHWSQVLSLLS